MSHRAQTPRHLLKPGRWRVESVGSSSWQRFRHRCRSGRAQSAHACSNPGGHSRADTRSDGPLDALAAATAQRPGVYRTCVATLDGRPFTGESGPDTLILPGGEDLRPPPGRRRRSARPWPSARRICAAWCASAPASTSSGRTLHQGGADLHLRGCHGGDRPHARADRGGFRAGSGGCRGARCGRLPQARRRTAAVFRAACLSGPRG